MSTSSTKLAAVITPSSSSAPSSTPSRTPRDEPAARSRCDQPEHDRGEDPAVPQLVRVHLEREPDAEHQHAEPAGVPQRERRRGERPPRGVAAAAQHQHAVRGKPGHEHEGGEHVEEQQPLVQAHARNPSQQAGRMRSPRPSSPPPRDGPCSRRRRAGSSRGPARARSGRRAGGRRGRAAGPCSSAGSRPRSRAGRETTAAPRSARDAQARLISARPCDTDASRRPPRLSDARPSGLTRSSTRPGVSQRHSPDPRTSGVRASGVRTSPVTTAPAASVAAGVPARSPADPPQPATASDASSQGARRDTA